eukprot:4977347-Alexandrium_andersonii.AAC.1
MAGQPNVTAHVASATYRGAASLPADSGAGPGEGRRSSSSFGLTAALIGQSRRCLPIAWPPENFLLSLLLS